MSAGTPFDALAPSYDALFETPTGRRARAQSLEPLLRSFGRGGRVLDIGCGTGEEALALARRGVEVVGLDPSEASLSILRKKLGREPALKVSTVMAAARDLPRLAAGLGRFDGAYSSFGALNCEPALAPVRDGLSAVLPRGAPFFVSVMNRTCLFEMAAGLLTLRPALAGRRLRDGPARVAGRPVFTRYYSPSGFAAAMAPAFRAKEVAALPVLLPPQPLSAPVDRRPALLEMLERADARLRGAGPWSSLGDHFQMTLVRT
jgi:SAM-dependent methyltransferase